MEIVRMVTGYITGALAWVGNAVQELIVAVPFLGALFIVLAALFYWDKVKHRRLACSRIVEIDELSTSHYKNFIRHKQQERVLGREQKVGDWDRTHVEELEEALKKINETADTFNVGLRFRVHEESGRIMVQVVDRTTDEVIREIPPERVLNLVAQIQSLIGLFIDARR